MPLIYGEGEGNAFKRLREEIDKHSNGNRHDSWLLGKGVARWLGGALSHIVTGIVATEWYASRQTKEYVCNEPPESDNTYKLLDEFALEGGLSTSTSFTHKQSNGSTGELAETPDAARSNKACKNDQDDQDDQDEEEKVTLKATKSSNLSYSAWI